MDKTTILAKHKIIRGVLREGEENTYKGVTLGSFGDTSEIPPVVYTGKGLRFDAAVSKQLAIFLCRALGNTPELSGLLVSSTEEAPDSVSVYEYCIANYLKPGALH